MADIDGARYVHTNLVARDLERLERFYREVFGCVLVPPRREQRGDWLARGTGVAHAELRGAHLRLPGGGADGPTLEIFAWRDGLDAPPSAANRRGYGHLAFEVPDVAAALAAVLRAGGSAKGEPVTRAVPGVGELTFVYAADPEDNILELQRWRRESVPEVTVEAGYARWAASYDATPNATRDLDARVLPGLLPPLAGRDVLELGCGTGKNTGALLAARSVTGLDLSEAMLAEARARHAAPNLTLRRHDLREPLPFPAAAFDLATCDLVLEHLRDVDGVVAEIARVLRPGGHLVVVEIHPYRQLAGSQARFSDGERAVRVEAYPHTTAELVGAGLAAGLTLEGLDEHRAPDAPTKPPRLLSLRFRR